MLEDGADRHFAQPLEIVAEFEPTQAYVTRRLPGRDDRVREMFTQAQSLFPDRQLGRALLRHRRYAAVLLDEAEDVLDAARSLGAQREAVSKVFLSRTLEHSSCRCCGPATRPTGWTRQPYAV